MNIYFVIVAGTLGMCLLAGGIITFTVIYRKRLVQQQVILKETQLNHQAELLHSAILAQENERRRVAADLHDEVGSLLAALRMMLTRAADEPDEAKKNHRLQEVKSLVDTVSASSRRIAHDLMPPSLETFGLAAALEDLIEHVKAGGYTVATHIPPGTTSGNKTVDLALFRISQELITNTLKHARADQIIYSLQPFEDVLKLEYSDNGKGITIPGGKGIGMKNIESRLSFLNGKMHFEPVSQGIKVIIAIPLETYG